MGLKLLFVLSLLFLTFILGLSIGLIRYMIKIMRRLKNSTRIVDRKICKKLRPIYASIYAILVSANTLACVMVVTIIILHI